MPFLGAHPSLLRALLERGLAEPTAVQRAILEVGDPSVDLMVSAQTGSGKTVAFGLALAPTLLGEAERFPPVPRGGPMPGPMALVIAPTRELAQQVARELSWLYEMAGGAIATCVGGMDPARERQALVRGPQFVVGTPGRLCDHLERGALVLSQLRAVVLDEADEMLDMGFRDELERLLKAMPEERRTLLFSATMPPAIAALAKRYQRNAVRVATAGEAQPHADITYQAIAIRPEDRLAATVNVLRYHESRGALVFCATREGVQQLTEELAGRGFAVVALSGELSQRERNRALAQLREGYARVLVATDVAARGLDLPALDLVVHADLPINREVMIHRSGRTGRAGRKGTSVLLTPIRRRGFVERVLASKTSPMSWVPAPTEREIAARDLARLDAELTGELAALDEPTRERGRELAKRMTADDLAALLVASRLAQLPTPAPLEQPGAERRPPPGRRRDGEDLPRPARGDHPRTTRTTRPGPHAAEDHAPRPRGRAGEPPTRGDYVLFRINVGRRGNADPKWLIPLLCRRGDIDRRAIGKILVLPAESHVEIARSHAAEFAAKASRPDPRDRKIHISPVEE